MSDSSQGEGWWQASDGKWYPPEAQPAYDHLPPPPSGATEETPSRRSRLLIVGLGVALAAVAVAGLIVISSEDESAEDGYLAAISDAGLNEWSTDRAAINAGFAICEALDGGGPERGSESDRLAVEYLCPAYLDGFRVLEQATVSGSFTVLDEDFTGRTEGLSCSPDGGYRDVNSSTQVVVRNSSGTELARTNLGPGSIGGLLLVGCRFEFELSLTEGESIYIVEVGDRGEISYTWEEISEPLAVDLSLGDAFD